MNKKYFKDLKRAVELFPNMFIQAKEVVSALGSKDIPDNEPEKKINSIEVGDLRQVKGVWRECVDPERNIWSPYKGNLNTTIAKKARPLPNVLNESDECKSFDDWIKEGRVVCKGEKSMGRDRNGTPMFLFSQTEPKPDTKNTRTPPHLREDFDEDDWTRMPLP